MMTGCMKWDYVSPEEFDGSGPGLFIVNEGNFQYGNASLSFYSPASGTVQNEVFIRANGFKLGDVAQSMTIRDDLGWIVVNNSHVIFAIDTDTFKERGRIENLPSPRYIHFVSDEKAYVSQIWDNRIFIINPKTYSVTGHITVPHMTLESGSTEQMVQQGKFVYVNCWSYQNRILKIDTESDEIVAELEVGIQPQSIALDCNGKLWATTDGGYEGSPYGEENPKLVKIDLSSFTVEKEWPLTEGEDATELQTNGSGNKIYWLKDDVWEMDVNAESLPDTPILPSRGTLYYGLTVSPDNGDIYVADAVDYQQKGMIYRYSSAGELIESFSVGITPAAFAWKR